ncbi:helix-turn-helix domain-containing protein [Actinomadura kijaniata]|uniref:helix-turn-helix domain-containing protein n=1 Tax=Actinomadura kijaniata TaxID=46161 RepID=UPI00082C7FFF|nr:helix-turn-helix transcriptional regulator [Actinomadura kijaniata]
MGNVRPTSDSLRFGAIVNEHRVLAKMTRAQLAAKFPISPSYIGRIIKGTARCTYENAQRLDEILDAGGEIVKAWKELGSGFPAYYQDFPAKEASAALIRTFSLLLVDGLFQTKEYASELLDGDAAIAERLRRQEVLTRVPSPMCCLVLDEGVLLRQVGGAETMRRQLEHLIEVSRRENIILQIAPFAYYRGVRSSFSIATQTDDSSVLYTEMTTGGQTTMTAAQVSKAVQVFARLQGRALDPESSRRHMGKVIEERWS